MCIHKNLPHVPKRDGGLPEREAGALQQVDALNKEKADLHKHRGEGHGDFEAEGYL